MNPFAPDPDADGIPLLTEVVEVPAEAPANGTAPAQAQVGSPSPQALPFPLPEPPRPVASAAPLAKSALSETGIPSSQSEDILRQFRDSWPTIIEAECQEAVQVALRQFSEQLVETLSVHLTITLQARLETWLESRLRS